MIWIKIGSLLMFLGVALGAFGAHALKDQLTGHYLDVYKSAVLYHFIHALGLLIIGGLFLQNHDPKIHLAGTFILLGIILFSGSLYILSITQIKWLGAITPLGGLSFLIGWGILLFCQWK